MEEFELNELSACFGRFEGKIKSENISELGFWQYMD